MNSTKYTRRHTNIVPLYRVTTQIHAQQQQAYIHHSFLLRLLLTEWNNTIRKADKLCVYGQDKKTITTMSIIMHTKDRHET